MEPLPTLTSAESKDGAPSSFAGFSPLSLEQAYYNSDDCDHDLYKMGNNIMVNVIPTNIASIKFSELAMSPFTPKPVDNAQSKSNEIEMIGILNQFEKYPYNQDNVGMLVTGYVNRIQTDYDVPKDINEVIHKFYFEEENKYLAFSQELYKIMMAKNMDMDYPQANFTGKSLLNAIMYNFSDLPLMNVQINEERESDEKNDVELAISRICHNLLRYGFIQLASYKLNFFSLFDDFQKEQSNAIDDNGEEKAVKFHGDSEHQYKFSSFRIEQFLQCIDDIPEH